MTKDTTAGGVEAIPPHEGWRYGELIYNALYASKGGQWSAVSDSDKAAVWYPAGYRFAVALALTPPATGDGAALERLRKEYRPSMDADVLHAWAADVIAALAASPAPAPAARVDLVERCREIISWHDTGLLTGAALRAFAERSGFDLEEHDALIRAENKTAREAMEFIIAVSIPPAGETGNE